MINILWRLCWNDAGWQRPSGPPKEKGYPMDNGFGHEEWNFCRDDAIDGFVYGYVYRTRIRQLKSQDEIFRLVFFAIDPVTKERFVCGIYNKAQIVAHTDYARIRASYRARGIFDRRASELLHIAPGRYTRRTASQKVRNSFGGPDPVRLVRCPVGQVEIPRARIPLGNIMGGLTENHRFKSFTYLHAGPLAKIKTRRQVRKALKFNSREQSEESYTRSSAAAQRVIIPRHRKLSNGFCRWLHTYHQARAITERSFVDVRFVIHGRDVLAELKICHGISPRKAIRESLGQLMEYNYYRGRVSAQEWLVVLDERPTENDRHFVSALRDQRGLPLFLGWRIGAGFKFFPSWP